MTHKDSLSAETQQLVDLTFNGNHPRDDVALSTVITEHPELIPGLDEYLKWRDEQQRMIAKTDSTPPVKHSASEALASALASAKPTAK